MRKFNEGFSKEAIKLNGAKFYYSNRYKIDRVYRQPSKKQELGKLGKFSALKNYVSFLCPLILKVPHCSRINLIMV